MNAASCAYEVVWGLREVASSGWVFPSREGTKKGHLTNMGGSLRRIRRSTSIPHWTVHDFRTTFRTWATRARSVEGEVPAGLGIEAHVADAVLGHKEASLGFSRYTGDRDRYLISEKREAMRRWGRFVRAAIDAE